VSKLSAVRRALPLALLLLVWPSSAGAAAPALTLKAPGATIYLHQVDFAFAFCPRTVALREGQVIFDGPTAALTPERLRELYGAQTDELLPVRGVPAAAPDGEAGFAPAPIALVA